MESEATEAGTLARFAALCERLAATTRKLEKRALIAEWLRSQPLNDAAQGALYLTGMPFPETDPRSLNIGGALLSKALAELSGADHGAMHAAHLRHGDLGAAAFDLLDGQAPKAAATLSLDAVGESFASIAAASRPAPKLRSVFELLRRATPLEAKYLIKLVLGDMRTGVKQSLVEEGIAAAYNADAATVRRASMLNGNLPEVVRMAAAGTLDHARMKLFHSLGFMLASPVDGVEEALARFAQEIAADVSTAAEGLPEAAIGEAQMLEAQMEDKFDGIRAQLHAGDVSQPGRVVLFSRSREDMTASFPELEEAFARLDRPVVLDGEILAWDPVRQRALPFSSLQQRVGRRRVTEEMRRRTPVVFMAFDLLYLNGELLLEQPLSARRKALDAFVAIANEMWSMDRDVPVAPGQGVLFDHSPSRQLDSDVPRLLLAPAVQLQSAEQLEQAYLDARLRGNEGVMLKARHSLYQPGRRGLAWLKLKRELATLDVVVTAVEYGHGRRASVLSDYTFAVRDGDELKNVGKAYSGLTDAEIAEYTAFFLDHTLEDFGRVRSVEPLVVLEVAFNNIMRSERHRSGFALRFPRIVRIRTDKLPEDADTLARVEDIYNSQPDRPAE